MTTEQAAELIKLTKSMGNALIIIMLHTSFATGVLIQRIFFK